MKIFLTGASGFVGSAVLRELLNAGHQVVGLARSEQSARAISDAGGTFLMGDLENLDILKQGAAHADGVIHTGFFHDFNQFTKAVSIDKNAIDAMSEVLLGTHKPILVTAGILGLPLTGGSITEASLSSGFPRSSETTALEWAAKGVHASVMRLAPSVHDKGDRGFIPFIIAQAIKNGISGYPESGHNRWPAVHRSDAAKAFRLAIEKPGKGTLYNIVAETGIPIRQIATIIGEQLRLPIVPLSAEATITHFEWMSRFIASDSPAIHFQTCEQLNWKPAHIGLLDDMRQNYFEIYE